MKKDKIILYSLCIVLFATSLAAVQKVNYWRGIGYSWFEGYQASEARQENYEKDQGKFYQEIGTTGISMIGKDALGGFVQVNKDCEVVLDESEWPGGELMGMYFRQADNGNWDMNTYAVICKSKI
jgi:hypothetical protein